MKQLKKSFISKLLLQVGLMSFLFFLLNDKGAAQSIPAGCIGGATLQPGQPAPASCPVQQPISTTNSTANQQPIQQQVFQQQNIQQVFQQQTIQQVLQQQNIQNMNIPKGPMGPPGGGMMGSPMGGPMGPPGGGMMGSPMGGPMGPP
ncbi:MAG: hypothetical protein EBR60_07605, partial [Burkholderiaceae bacterium]|nr:hypothetical protein [Burkholderiaceae bacterium]